MLFQYHMFESMQYMLNGIKTTAAKKKKNNLQWDFQGCTDTDIMLVCVCVCPVTFLYKQLCRLIRFFSYCVPQKM